MSNQDKGKFWSKVKNSTKQLTTTLGNVSLRTEHDGDSPESTLIHKALVSHYTKEGHGYPEWLGVPEEKQHQIHQNPNSVQRQPLEPQQNYSQQYQTQQTQESAYEGENKYRARRAGGGNRFKDIYSTGGQNTAPVPPSHVADSGDKGNKSALMRDRLKRNNYRNNFGV